MEANSSMKASKAAESQVDDEVTQLACGPDPRHFYLLRPATATATKVLIPLNVSFTLTVCLKNQLVQEYPTLYVLPNDPSALPEGFSLYSDYLQDRRREDAEMERLQKSTAHTGYVTASQTSGHTATDPAPLDAQSILKMLKRDTRT
jgi:hypothetical protein